MRRMWGFLYRERGRLYQDGERGAENFKNVMGQDPEIFGATAVHTEGMSTCFQEEPGWRRVWLASVGEEQGHG